VLDSASSTRCFGTGSVAPLRQTTRAVNIQCVRFGLDPVIRAFHSDDRCVGDTVEKLQPTKIASEFWNAVPSDRPQANGVSEVGPTRKDILAIRRFSAGYRLFQHNLGQSGPRRDCPLYLVRGRSRQQRLGEGGVWTSSCEPVQSRWVYSRFGTRSMRRTKAALIYRKIGNLRAVQLLTDLRAWCRERRNRDIGRGEETWAVRTACLPITARLLFGV
jgi:hypothetical protein